MDKALSELNWQSLPLNVNEVKKIKFHHQAVKLLIWHLQDCAGLPINLCYLNVQNGDEKPKPYLYQRHDKIVFYVENERFKYFSIDKDAPGHELTLSVDYPGTFPEGFPDKDVSTSAPHFRLLYAFL